MKWQFEHMRRAVRAIIIKDGQLLVMHRNKFGKEYDTLPGGNVELDEQPEQALARELMEEAQLEFANPRLVFLEQAGEPYGQQYIYLCDYVSGEPMLQPGSEEDVISKMGHNLYKTMWIKLSDLPAKPFLSEALKQAILQHNQRGWPDKPLEIA